MESIFYIVKSIIALVAVIWLANVALKYINKISNNQNRSIQIVERISVSKASSLAIVKILDDYYLMSFSEQNNETLQKFTKEEAAEIEARLEEQKSVGTNELFKEFDLTETKDKFRHYFEKIKEPK